MVCPRTMNILVLVLLFCVTFILVWMFSERPSYSKPAQSAIVIDEQQQTLAYSDKQDVFDGFEKKADAIIIQTDNLIQEHGLDHVSMSKGEKQALIDRQAQLKKQLKALKNP